MNFEADGGATRDDLVRRLELMEAMIAEGRGMTARYGWIFVLWGLVDFVAMGWRYFEPQSHWVGMWAWPVCLVAGAVITCVGLALQKRAPGRGVNTQCRSVEGVWAMMGGALAIYVAGAMARHLTWQYSYVAGLLVIVGMAHGISAVILRWRVQAVVAAIWWLGGIAVFCVRSQHDIEIIMLVEMCFGMIAFGLYVMMRERRHG
jgi:hypothetical protein